MKHTVLTTHSLGFSTSDKTLFANVHCSVRSGDHIGLVGKNGTGKSTLLKILAGIIVPTEGSVTRPRVYYMPQIDLTESHTKTVAEFLREQHADAPLVAAELHKLFGDTLRPEQHVQTLSGGELVRLNLAIGAVHDPELLLLDEPTNHLDVSALRVLEEYLRHFRGAYVIVSHDPTFLDRAVTRIWAIEDEKVTEYGGNYSYYKEEEKRKDEARLRAVEDGRKTLQKQRNALEKTETRYARGEREQRRIRADDAKDKFAKGAAKDSSQKSAGKWRVRLRGEMESTKDVLENLSVRRRTVHIKLEEQDVGRRSILNLSNATLSVGTTKLATDVTLSLSMGDRVAIVGPNGVGKSSLMHAILGTGAKLEGSVKRLFRNAAFVDQKYHVINPNETLLANVERMNDVLTTQEVRDQLARFMFTSTPEVQKKAEVLSGGEAARLTLAMVTASPIDLLVLDEPTNNVDIETLDVIAEALRDFSGALVVISHNVYFLEKLGIERAYRMTRGGLRLMMSSPQTPEDFYNEITSTL